MQLGNAKLVFLDVETSGLSPAMGDRIVEIGMIICHANGDTQRASQLINPQRPIPADVQRIHGIRNDDVAHAPTFESAASGVCNVLDQAWIIGHNVRFDVGFLAMEIAIAGHQVTPLGCLDTCQLAQAMWDIPDYQLGTVVDFLGIDGNGEHRALADAALARSVFHRVLTELGGGSQVGVTELHALHTHVPVWPTDPRRSLPGPLYDALTSGRPILIQYVNSEGVSSSRTIRPHACFPVGPHLYIRARCAQTREMRTFRLDRIIEIASPAQA